MIDRRPVCPGCEAIAVATLVNGVARWKCETPGCPCSCFDDSFNPHPVPARTQRTGDLFDRRDRA